MGEVTAIFRSQVWVNGLGWRDQKRNPVLEERWGNSISDTHTESINTEGGH